MSRHFSALRAEHGDNVGKVLLEMLLQEDSSIVAAHAEVERCLSAFERRLSRVRQLREALRALGVEPPHDGDWNYE
jgi:hypothetical protein